MGNSNSVINGVDRPSFSMTPAGITISGSTKKYKTYAEMLAEKNPPSYAYVIDASADPTVGYGGAFYRWTGASWKKMYEEESMDNDIDVSIIKNKLATVSDKVDKYLTPVWIPVDHKEDEALFEVDTTLGNYYSIHITDADVETFGTEFQIDFKSTVIDATYTNTIPLEQNNAYIIVDVAVDNPSKNVKIIVDGVAYCTPNRLDIYWNGTKAVLDPRTKQIRALQAEIEELKSKSANIETIFVNDGTNEHPAEVALSDDEWCVMTSPFVATLPENAKNGDSIHMSVEHGSAKMTVVAPSGVTINGSSMPCLVGVDGDGIPINNISFYFVFNAAQNNWIVL